MSCGILTMFAAICFSRSTRTRSHLCPFGGSSLMCGVRRSGDCCSNGQGLQSKRRLNICPPRNDSRCVASSNYAPENLGLWYQSRKALTARLASTDRPGFAVKGKESHNAESHNALVFKNVLFLELRDLPPAQWPLPRLWGVGPKPPVDGMELESIGTHCLQDVPRSLRATHSASSRHIPCAGAARLHRMSNEQAQVRVQCAQRKTQWVTSAATFVPKRPALDVVLLLQGRGDASRICLQSAP